MSGTSESECSYIVHVCVCRVHVKGFVKGFVSVDTADYMYIYDIVQPHTSKQIVITEFIAFCFCQVQWHSVVQHLDKALAIFSWIIWAVLELNSTCSTVPTME